MMPNDQMILWKPEGTEIALSRVKEPADIAAYAVQLSQRDKRQIIQAFQAENYEIVVSYVWAKAMGALKRELATIGMKFLGEMLNRPELNEEDEVLYSITDKEALRLAEELGIVSSTEALRLRHIQELLAHLSNLDAHEIDIEDAHLSELEAINFLKVCVKNILGKPRIEVATKFIEFRDALESGVLKGDESLIFTLLESPYFFQKLTVSILMSVVKKSSGAKLEKALANVNTILPLIWRQLSDTEKWQVGYTYRDVYTEGQTTAASGLKQALLKVKGFDYVPESLRSDTFCKAAEAVIKAHEGMNNFYNEEQPMRTLMKLGSSIPPPAFSICASAIISVRLGNYYGVSFSARPLADKMLDDFTLDRWEYYLNVCFPGDIRVLQKLIEKRPRNIWCSIVQKYKLVDLNLKNKHISTLVKASFQNKEISILKSQQKLLTDYYGSKRQ